MGPGQATAHHHHLGHLCQHHLGWSRAHRTHGGGSGAQDGPSPGGLCLGGRFRCQAAGVLAFCSSLLSQAGCPGWSVHLPAAHRKCQAPLGPCQRPLLTIGAPCLLALHLGLVTPIPRLGGRRTPTGLGTKPMHVSGLGLRHDPILVPCVREGCAYDAGVRGLRAGLLGPSHSRGRSILATQIPGSRSFCSRSAEPAQGRPASQGLSTPESSCRLL